MCAFSLDFINPVSMLMNMAIWTLLIVCVLYVMWRDAIGDYRMEHTNKQTLLLILKVIGCFIAAKLVMFVMGELPLWLR